MEERKLAKARDEEQLKLDPKYVAPKEDFTSNNSILEYARDIIIATLGHFKLTRPTKYGGSMYSIIILYIYYSLI